MPRLALLCVLALALPASAQEYKPDAEDGFFTLGWGPREVYAFGWYTEAATASHACKLVVVVQDLTTDTSLYELEKSWQGGTKDPCPGAASAAWAQVSANASKRLATLAVVPRASKLRPLPAKVDKDTYTLEVGKADRGFTFTAVSAARGRQLITNNQSSECDTPTPRSWVTSPDGRYIAFVVQWEASAPLCPAYQVVGAPLRSGYAPAGKP